MKFTRYFAIFAISAVFSAGCAARRQGDVLADARAALDAAALAQRCAEAEYRAAQNLLAQAEEALANGDRAEARRLAAMAAEQANRAHEIAEANRENCDDESTLSDIVADLEPEGIETDPRLAALAGHEWIPIYFEFNESALTLEAREALELHAQWLVSHADERIQIQGHCDERGSTEYNLALGERRARSVRDYLQRMGVALERMTIVSFGEEMPADPGNADLNRRAEFRVRP
jgi:peptidoglycan-associated lipoprotein